MAAFSHTKSTPGWLALLAAVIMACSGDALWAKDEAPGVAEVAAAHDVATVASGRVLVGYHTAPNSPAAAGAELWYTTDRGKTWQRHGVGRNAENPLTFDAPSDGLYGFYLVLYGDGGRSESPQPQPGSAPQQWVYVDRAAPLVQVLAVVPDERFDLNREINIRWAVQDENLPNRPVSLSYRDGQVKSFQTIADSLPANSSYRWTVPADVSGRLEIRVLATDRAGNVGRYVADWLRIEGDTVSDSRRAGTDGQQPGTRRPRANSPASTQASVFKTGMESQNSTTDGSEPGFSEPEGSPKSVSEGAAAEAQKRYDLGTWHRLRGEQEEAKTRFGEALKLNPDLLAARNDLAGLLFLQGDYEGAERELGEVLAKDPRHRPALKTLALVQATRRNYRSSSESLQKLVLLDAEDAEAWLYLGDIRLFMGERAAAREAWTKAASLSSASEDTKQRAQKRLSIYRSDSLAVAPEQ